MLFQVNFKVIKLLSVTVALLIVTLKLMESVSELMIVVLELVEVILDIFHCRISVELALVSEYSFSKFCIIQLESFLLIHNHF